MRRRMPVLVAALGLLAWPLGPASTSAGASGAADDGVPAPVAAELTAAAADGDAVEAVLIMQPAVTPPSVPGAADREAVIGELKAASETARATVAAALRARDSRLVGARLGPALWINNSVLVSLPGAAAESGLAALAELPGVARIVPNFTLTAPEAEAAADPATPAAAADGEVTWGIERIGADRAWAELGVDGGGVRIATLDTGVDISHPDLAGKMITTDPDDASHPGGWMEFGSDGGLVSSTPHDSAVHGTHVAGTIHGGATSGVAVGVAPGAQMMHGLVLPGGEGTFMQVVAGMQWAIDPVDVNGDPAGEPADVVNMSLGVNQYVQEMIEPTRAIIAAGAFPAFAIGNRQFGSCGVGSGSPGNVFEAVGVGNTTVDDDVNDGSCGNVVSAGDWADPPAEWPDSYVVPDVSAPGTDVWSAAPGGGYQYLTGTSMAAPHVAGTVALMAEAAQGVDVEAARQALIDTSFFDDRHGSERPNPRFGWGRIDAYEATLTVALDSGVAGTVTNAATGEPLAGAQVLEPVSGRARTTGTDGGWRLPLVPGTYRLEVSRFGYASTTAEVTVAAGEVGTVDLALDQAPSGTIAGTITYQGSGHGVPGATARLAGVPIEPASTTGADGRYEIPAVPAGSYRLEVTTDLAPEPLAVDVTVTADTVTTTDVEVPAPGGEPAPRYVTWDLRVDHEEVLAGEPVTVSVAVTNVGAASGGEPVELRVGWRVEASTDVELAPGETRTVSWPVTRSELGGYDLFVGSLTGRFRVRAPRVELSATTVSGAGSAAGPLAGATVELLAGDELVDVGSTDAAGTLTFETTAPDAEYTVVVRRPATADHPYEYLLLEPVRVATDTTLAVRPDAAADAVLDLTLDRVGDWHQAATYLRHELTGTLGFAVAPGTVVATAGGYDLRHVHAVTGFERDWWSVSAVEALDLTEPRRHAHEYGGPAEAVLDVVQDERTQWTATWAVTDAHGHPFALMAETELRPWDGLPDAVVLDQLPDLVAGEAPYEADAVLRVNAPLGEQIFGTGLDWDEATVSLDVDAMTADVRHGRYEVSLDVDTGGYRPGDLTADESVRVRPLPNRP
ncbi:S8 family serine peptidase [Jiangella asiatica]|uniref:alpha-amylase n=1 Tax=Jiangella asiatica TaxID=2530372 RepID=A0A4R5CMA7_9ACTN|nr:S8 family serine peptidase [Jiangella asiatica]TDE01492.1 hypothetical protein E1269_23215 [Jiangella asiatica]